MMYHTLWGVSNARLATGVPPNTGTKMWNYMKYGKQTRWNLKSPGKAAQRGCMCQNAPKELMKTHNLSGNM